jgi:N-methylhydantoinase B
MAKTQTNQIDSVTTAVVYNRILGVCHEMRLALVRASYSPNIKQRGDCSTCILSASGEIVGHAPQIAPAHLGSMIGTLELLFKQYPLETIKPGDMWLANDPYSGGGQHLPDFNVVAPVFSGDRCVAFVANTAHHADVGGMLAGSEASVSRSIYQDGLRVPLVRIVQAGSVVQDILRIIMLNSRRPADRKGDVMAQVAANTIGNRRLQEVYDRFGPDTVSSAMMNYLEYTETRFRAAIEQLNDGSYYAEDYLDPEPEDPEARPVRIALTLTKAGSRLIADFGGTAEQVGNSCNAPYNALSAAVYTLVKNLVDPDLPDNSGYYRAIEVLAPEGSVVNPRPGAAVGARAFTMAVIGDVVARALSKALPSRALAGSGPHLHLVLSGEQGDGSLWVDYETVAGGYGARPYRDGMDAVRIHVAGSLNLPVEALEQIYSLLIERYELRQDSGGAGRHRGGQGVVRDYRALAKMSTSLSGHRCVVPAKGMAGGHDGMLGQFVLNPGTPHEQHLSSALGDLHLRPGDVLSIRTPGGGGFGDPAERDKALVQQDLEEGRISESAAAEVYGYQWVGKERRRRAKSVQKKLADCLTD